MLVLLINKETTDGSRISNWGGRRFITSRINIRDPWSRQPEFFLILLNLQGKNLKKILEILTLSFYNISKYGNSTGRPI